MRTDPPFVQEKYIEAARRVALVTRDHVDEIERGQKIPDELVTMANDAELFRLYAKQAVGGPELDPFTTYRVMEELARADGSMAWVAMLSTTQTY
ncbi:MAG: hypothetical protein F2754_13115, partial [Actinobacteria bacterium]|nr:hypothetical protein [Actinomycetota bacterium]